MRSSVKGARGGRQPSGPGHKCTGGRGALWHGSRARVCARHEVGRRCWKQADWGIVVENLLAANADQYTNIG